MPRRSKAELSTVPAVPMPRPAPPSYLPPDEAEIWNTTVQGLPPHWLPVGSLPLLEVFCAAVCGMRACRAVMLAEPEGSPRHHAASRLYRAEAAQVVKIGKLLRITPRHDRTRLRSIPNLPKPWDICGDGGDATVSEKFTGWPGWPPPEPEDEPPAA